MENLHDPQPYTFWSLHLRKIAVIAMRTITTAAATHISSPSGPAEPDLVRLVVVEELVEYWLEGRFETGLDPPEGRLDDPVLCCEDPVLG